jgi:hypothetical protein
MAVVEIFECGPVLDVPSDATVVTTAKRHDCQYPNEIFIQIRTNILPCCEESMFPICYVNITIIDCYRVIVCS